MTRIAIVAGEASGDALGASVIRAAKARWPDAQFFGVAGPKMMAEGARTLFPMEKLSVRGLIEVLRSVPAIWRLRRALGAEILRERPDLFVGIDAPDFNFGLESRLRSAGIRTVHVVSPSIWLWRPGRIRTIARAVDRMLVLFPFEEAIYRKAGVPVSFVGHPLADEMPLAPDRDEARVQLRLGPVAPVVALLPGSRMGELELHADLMLETAAELHARRPELRFVVPLATRETREYFEARLFDFKTRFPAASTEEELPITVLFGHARLALHAADVALVASGTATLEAALARCPMVVTYRLNPLTFNIVKSRALLPYVGLPNILAGEFVVPELLQDEATAPNLAQALLNWLDNKAARERLRERFASLHASLACGHEARIADALAASMAGA